MIERKLRSSSTTSETHKPRYGCTNVQFRGFAPWQQPRRAKPSLPVIWHTMTDESRRLSESARHLSCTKPTSISPSKIILERHTDMRIVSARVELVFLWKVGALHDVYSDFYRDLAFKAISTPLKHQKIIAFECFRNFRATARSCNATDQSRACKIRIFFRLLQLFIQLRGSGTGSKNHPTTRSGDWIKKCIQVLKRPCVFANALTRDNVWAIF